MAKICIDPGHYGKYNRCPAIPEYYESEMVWKLSQYQKQYLEALGHEVVMTRTIPSKDLSLNARGTRSKGCDLLISNHSNAVGSAMNESVRYVAVYHLVDDSTTSCDDVSADIAGKIAPVIASTMGVTYRILTRASSNDRNHDGFLNDNYYGVLHGCRSVNVPGLILEHSFHTNTASVQWLLKDENLQRLAKAEAECIDKYFNADKKPEVAAFETFKVKVAIKDLAIVPAPGKPSNKACPTGVYTITEVIYGNNSKKGWGKLKSGAGWINLDYVTIL